MKYLSRGLSVLSTLAIAITLTACGGKQTPSTTPTDSTNVKEEKTSNVIHLDKASFLAKVVNFEASPKEWKYLGDKPAIVDFYATWCGPCKMIAPLLEELATEYKDQIVIYKVDTDQEQALASAFGIRSIPSLLFIPMQGQPTMYNGMAPKEELKNRIETILLNQQ